MLPTPHRLCRLLLSLLLVLGAGALQAGDRVDGRFWTEIRPERLVTPCAPFAADYIRPPKLLFLVPGRTGAREVAELKQRFNFVFDAVLYQGPWGNDALGQGGMYIDPINGARQAEKLEKLNRLLEREKWDAIVFGHNTQFSGLSPRAQHGVLKLVATGTGLVLFQPDPTLSRWKFPKEIEAGLPASGVDERFPGAAPAAQVRLRATLRACVLDEILPGVPVALLPPYEVAAKASGMAQVWKFGRGLVVWMSTKGNGDGNVNVGWHALTPYRSYTLEEEGYYDQYLSAAAKAILAAIPTKAPRVKPAGENPRVVDIVDGGKPGTVAAGLFAVPEAMTVQAVIQSLTGDRVALPDQTLPADKAAALSFDVPALPSGDHFLNYRFVSKAGTEYWGALGVKVAPAAAGIAALGIPGAPPTLERKENGLAVPVKLSGDALKGLILRYEGTGRDGRVIFRGQQPVTGPEFELKAGLELATGIPHVLRVELWQGQRCLQVARSEFFVRQPMPAFVNLVWGSGYPTVLGLPMMAQLRTAGFNTFMYAGDPGNAVITARGNAHTMDYCFRVGVHGLGENEKDPDATYANPDFLQKKLIEKQGGPAKAAGPYRDFIHIYNLGDENGFDYSRPRLAPSELKAFQAFVKAEYAGDLALLNREWGTNLATFDAITVPDLDKPIDMAGIPRKHLWMKFVEGLYADIHHRAAAAIRQGDPDPDKFIGAEGSKMGDPELTLPGLTMWGPYPNRLDNALMRSFGSPNLLRGNWWGGYLAERAAGGQPLWNQVLSGGVNASFYFQSDGGEGMLGRELSLTDFFEKEQWPVMQEINAGVGPLLAHLPTAKMGLGIFYSRVSDQAQTVDVRFGSAGSTRDGLLAWAEAAGIPAFFYSATQIAAGKLSADGVKLLFLPQTLCVDDATPKNLSAWVRAGGTLVADLRPGLRNQRGALRTGGALDALFGVTQDLQGAPKILTANVPLRDGMALELQNMIVDATLKAGDAKPLVTTADGMPLLLTRTEGKGTVLLLNFTLGKALANQADDPALTVFMKGLLAGAGVDTALEAPAGYLVTRFQGEGVQLLSCRIMTGAADGAAVRLGRKCFVYDVRLGKALGELFELVPSAGAGRNTLYTLSPAPIGAFALKMDGQVVRGKVTELVVSPSAGKGEISPRRFYRLSVRRPDGAEELALRAFQWGAGLVRFRVPLALNLPAGAYRAEVTDVLTGQVQSVGIQLP
jgi:hypothetical protein